MRQIISSGGPWEERVGYARAVRVGETVYVAGTTAARPDGSVEGEGDAYLQTRVALKRIAWALEQAGARIEHVVQTRIYVTDIARWEEVGRAHGEVFRTVRPAATMVEVRALIDPRLLVEIEAVAVITPL